MEGEGSDGYPLEQLERAFCCLVLYASDSLCWMAREAVSPHPSVHNILHRAESARNMLCVVRKHVNQHGIDFPAKYIGQFFSAQ